MAATIPDDSVSWYCFCHNKMKQAISVTSSATNNLFMKVWFSETGERYGARALEREGRVRVRDCFSNVRIYYKLLSGTDTLPSTLDFYNPSFQILEDFSSLR